MDSRSHGEGAELNLLFRLTGDGSSFQSAVNSAKASAGGLSSTMGKQFAGLGGMIAGAFSVGAVVNLARETIAFGGQITDLSQRYGISTDMVQKLKFAAEQSGSSVESMLGGFKKMNLAMQDALGGNEEKQDAFQRMGVSMDDLKSKSPEEVFRMIARAAKDMPHTPQLFADIKDVLGKSGDELLPAFKAGLDAAIATAEKLGLVMNKITIAALDNVGDQFAVVKLRAMSTFAPVIAFVSEIAFSFFDYIEAVSDILVEKFGGILAIAQQIISLDFKGALNTAKDMAVGVGKSALVGVAKAVTGDVKGAAKMLPIVGGIVDMVSKAATGDVKGAAKALPFVGVGVDVADRVVLKGKDRGAARAEAAEKKKAEAAKAREQGDPDEKESAIRNLENLRAANEAAALKRQPLDIQILEKKKQLAAAEERMMAANAAALRGAGGAELAQEKALAEKIKIEGELTALKPKDTAPMAAASQDALARIGGSRGGKSPVETISAQQLEVAKQLLAAIQTGNQNTAVLNP